MDTYHNTKLLIQAAKWGDENEVQRLIPVSNPKEDQSEALRNAAYNGHSECVRLLIPVSDAKSFNSSALFVAARKGHSECVKLLIPVSDPKAGDSRALYVAVREKHTDCVDLLLDVSDPQMALNDLQTEYPDEPEIWHPLEEKIAQRQKHILNNALDKSDHYLIKHKRKI